jgi:cytoskeletal protein RodZ
MSDSLGERLQRARLGRGLSLEQAARETRLRLHYLQALENDHLEQIPSQAQLRGFLRIYSEYLGLENETILSSLDGQPEASNAPAEPSQSTLPGASDATVDEIFNEIGQQLKKRRELLGLSIDDVSRHTKLRGLYLRYLEDGQFASLPSLVQARGMLGSYTQFLGIDPDPLLLRYADALQAQLAARQAARSRPKIAEKRPATRQPGWVRRMFSPELILVTISVPILIGFLGWAAIRVFSIASQQQPTATPQSIANLLLLEPTNTPTPSPAPFTPTPPSVAQASPTALIDVIPAVTPEAGNESLVRVYVTVRQRAWMRVSVDGKTEFEGRVLPGSAYQYTGEQSVEILTGNGAALQIFYGQQDLGLMGELGEVRQQVFTREGLVTPTPTSTPTPTETPRLTPSAATPEA